MSKKQKFILFTILGLAFFLRIFHWIAVGDDPFFAQLIMDSHEYDRWAQEIAGGNWMGSETFFQAPLYPYLLAVLYRIFGHKLGLVYLVQILFAVGGCYALFRAGRKIASVKVGLAAAALAAAYSVFIFYDVQIMKESAAVTLACFLLWALVEARDSGRIRIWFIAGLLCGILSLLRENMLLVAPFLLLLTYRSNERIKFFLLRGGSLLLGVIIILTPVAFRNWRVGGNFLPTTFQGGVNFYIGNNPQSSGTYQSIVPGKQVPHYERSEPVRIAEQEMGRDLSPMEVSNFWLKKSLSWAVQHPLGFVKLQLKKIYMFWSFYELPDAVDYYYVKRNSFILNLPLIEFGSLFILTFIGLWLIRDRLLDFSSVLVFVLAWMVSTVIFFIFSRYRLPAVPGLILLAAMPIAAIFEAWKRRLFLRVGVISVCAFLALGAPYITKFEPRMDLVHYNLALIYENLGQSEKAGQHYREALSSNPGNFLSCINLGNLAARGRDWTGALEWYKRAVEIEPRSEGAHSNLGGAYVALGELDKAEFHFDKALIINPRNIEALHNKAVLMAKRGYLREARKLNQKVLEFLPDWEPALRFRIKLGKLSEKK